jgi:hypothetical protein
MRRVSEMKDYSKMSDFDINCEVAAILKVTSKTNSPAKGFNGNSITVWGRGSSAISIDYCNNPEDAWPVMKLSRISLIAPHIAVGDSWVAQCKGNYFVDKNPLKAAMIAFLMNDKEVGE